MPVSIVQNIPMMADAQGAIPSRKSAKKFAVLYWIFRGIHNCRVRGGEKGRGRVRIKTVFVFRGRGGLAKDEGGSGKKT